MTAMAVVAITLLWALAPLPVPLGARGPLLFDEGAMLEEALEMARPGTYAAAPPGTRYVSARPLHIAAVSLVIGARGPVPNAAALVNALAAALALAAMAGAGACIGGARLGVLAPAMLAASNLFLHLSRASLAEPLPILFLVLALWSLFELKPSLAGAAFALSLLANPRFLLAAPALALVAPWQRASWKLAAYALLGAIVALALGACVLDVSAVRALAATNAEFVSPGDPFDYPVFLASAEGFVYPLLAAIGLAVACKAGEVRRRVAAAAVASLLALTFAYSHHELRYLSLALPFVALCAAFALERIAPEGVRPAAVVSAAAFTVCALLRPSLPGGDGRAYADVLGSIPAQRTVLATNFPVLRYLAHCGTAPRNVFPPVRQPEVLRRMATPDGAEVVLDFERWFLARWWRGEKADVGEDWLRAHAKPAELALPDAWAAYVWLEHGVRSPTSPAPDLTRIERFSVTP